jgi:LysM repeat protein
MQHKNPNIEKQMILKQIQDDLSDSWNKKKSSSRCKTFFGSNLLRPSILLGVLLLNVIFFIFGGCSKETFKAYLDPIKERLEQLEKKLTQLEGQSTEIKESVTKLNSYGKTLEERIETLTKKIDKMASQVPSCSAKTPPAVPQKTISQGKKQYHKVVPGETLYSISKKYGLSVDEVHRLNSLKPNQPIQLGQKLLVAPGSHQ